MAQIGSRHIIMHPESWENTMTFYVIYENCYHHYNINVKYQIGMKEYDGDSRNVPILHIII